MSKTNHDRMTDLFDTVAYVGEVRPWRDLPELATSDDEPDDDNPVPSRAHRKDLGGFDEGDHPRDASGKFVESGGSFGRSAKVDAVVRDALDEMGDRQADPREHHIAIDAETGERLFDVTGDAGGAEGALAKGIKDPTLDDLRPSAGVVPYGKVHDKQVIDIHTHPRTKGGAFSGEDLGLFTGSHLDTMLVVDDDSVGVLRKTDAFRQHQEAAWKRDTTEKTPAAERPWYPRRVVDRYNEVLDEMTTPDKEWEVGQVLHDALKQVAGEMGVTFSVMPRKSTAQHGKVSASNGYRQKLIALSQSFDLGDIEGHPFRGNQYADVAGSGEGQKRAQKGGEIGPNGEWYPGGAFIATTDMPKLERRKLAKLAGSDTVAVDFGRREQIAPHQIPIFREVGTTMNRDFTINEKYLESIQREHPDADYAAQLREASARAQQGERLLDIKDFPALTRVSDVARLIVAGQAVPGAALDRAKKVRPDLDEYLTRYTPEQAKS